MHRNNFDLLRLLAAAAVLVTHALSNATRTDALDPLYRVTNGQLTLGVAGVFAFFVMSGYLVTQSWDRRPDPVRFAWARFLRIYPLLTAVVLLTMFVLGPLTTTLPDYWAQPDTWAYFGVLALHDFPRTLPGVFTSTDGAVNSPLWSLWYEVGCYAILAVMGALRLLNARTVLVLFAVTCVQFWLMPEVRENEWMLVGRGFLAGSVAYFYRDHLRYSLLGVLAAVALFAVSIPEGLVRTVAPLSIGYVVLAVAFSQRLTSAWVTRMGDASYGVYVMHWPVQKIILLLIPAASWELVLAVSLPLALALGLLSWHLLEKPALRWKDRLPFTRSAAFAAD